jgi:hypothetical protein
MGTISTSDGGTIEQALAAAKGDPDITRGPTSDPTSGQDIPVETKELDANREERRSQYMVVRQVAEGTLEVIGSFEAATQRGARLAAVEANPSIKDEILAGGNVSLAAIANFNLVPAGVKRRDPELSV